MVGRVRAVAAVVALLLAASCGEPASAPPPADPAPPPAPATASGPCRTDPEEQHALEQAAERWAREQQAQSFTEADALSELCAFEHYAFLDGKALSSGPVIHAGMTRWDVKICGFDRANFGWVQIRTASIKAGSDAPLEALRVPHDSIDRCLDPHDVYFLQQAGATSDVRRMQPGERPWAGIVLWRSLAPSAPEKNDRQGIPPNGGPDND